MELRCQLSRKRPLKCTGGRYACPCCAVLGCAYPGVDSGAFREVSETLLLAGALGGACARLMLASLTKFTSVTALTAVVSRSDSDEAPATGCGSTSRLLWFFLVACMHSDLEHCVEGVRLEAIWQRLLKRYICLSVCLCVCLSVCLSVCLCLSKSPPPSPSVSLSLYAYIQKSTCREMDRLLNPERPNRTNVGWTQIAMRKRMHEQKTHNHSPDDLYRSVSRDSADLSDVISSSQTGSRQPGALCHGARV